ncbi:MAG: hypothetical protein LM601_08730 [Candidatus Verstraetearchaeota archaeon]|nr:hypothetical protein [Candidatus Verstraetearchaeota archaeon]
MALFKKMSKRDALKLLGFMGGALAYLAFDIYVGGPITSLISEMIRDKERPIIKRVAYEKYAVRGFPHYVDINATDNVGIESVLLEVIDPNGNSSYYKANKVDKDIYRVSFTPSLKGSYEARAIVKDTSGNVSISESFKIISLTETEDRLRRICSNEKIFEKGYELVNDLELSERKLRDESLEALKNYSISLVYLNLPYEKEGLSMLIEASEINPAIVDFEPIVFNSIDGNNFVLNPNMYRETWMLAKHMKLIKDSGFDILNHPEMFEGLNGKIIANAYSIFDAKYGINYAEQTLNGRTLKPTDKDVWDLIMLQWNLYSNKAPQLGGGNKLYNRDFPWYDSDKLDALYQDANTRRQALLFFFYLDNATFDMERAQKFGLLVDTLSLPRDVETDLYELLMWGRTEPNEYYKPIYPYYKAESIDDILKWVDLVAHEKGLIDENTAEKLKSEIKTIPPRFTPVGIEGAKTALIQAEREYEAISKLYPGGKIILPYTGIPADPRAVYYSWVNDRGFHGLWNTHIQFLGMDPQTLLDINRNSPYEYWGNPQKYVENFNSVDQYITKNWKYWDLVKFAMGYERWNKTNFPGMYERCTINYTIPQTLKAFGFPAYWVGIEPTPIGAANYEWVVSLPDYIVNKLKSEFNDKIIIGSANGFGLYFCKDGLIKDGISEIFGFSGGTGLLADKQPSLGLGPNFIFYLLKK